PRNGCSIAPIQGMRKLLPTIAFTTFVIAASAASAQVSVGVRIGEPPPPRTYHVPARPSANHQWVEGYWEPQGSKYRWHDGHWARPPHQGDYWQQPYYSNGRYYRGAWERAGTPDHERR